MQPTRTFANCRKCCKSSTSNKQLSFQNFFHTTTKSLHRNKIDFCGVRQIYVDNLALRVFWVVQADKGVRKGGWGYNHPLEFDILQNLYCLRKVDINCFRILLLVNLSTYSTNRGMNLYANFKEHYKWAKKWQLGFCGNLGYRLHPETISPLFADLSSTTHV